jgi:integrase
VTALAPAGAGDGSGPWRWPGNAGQHDRREMTAAERDALRELGADLLRRHGHRDDARLWRPVRRLLLPLDEARASLRWQPSGLRHHERGAAGAVGLVLARSGQLGTAWQQWTDAEWASLIGTSSAEFRRAWPWTIEAGIRPYVLFLAYVAGGFSSLHEIGRFHRPALAWRAFGRDAVDDAAGQVSNVLTSWGYHGSEAHWESALCHLLLVNPSPSLHDLTSEFLQEARAGELAGKRLDGYMHGIHRALAELGYVAPPPAPVFTPGPAAIAGAPQAWAELVERWCGTSALTPKVRSSTRAVLAKAGRWTAAEQPGIAGPADWTRQTCASWVAAVDRMSVGDYVQRPATTGSTAGNPLKPKSKASYLRMTRTFFRDLQEWEWIPRRFDPATALRTPRSVKALTGPDPRVIADDIWAKLLWAGLNLTAEDLPSTGVQFYPLELIRAITLTWLFSGQRSDEIARLRTGCIRWQHDGAGISGDDRQVLARDAVCLLDVPVHKTGNSFTKPVDPLMGEAIEAWQKARPLQPKMLDRKTAEQADFLFAYRARRVASHYINDAVIPVLCAKAGVPAADVRGKITSHRARSTIASQLYNAKEPMTLFELQAWLGHASPETTQHYAKITPNTLTRAYKDAGYFERNVRTIEVLIDRDAVASGQAEAGEPWQHYDLGHGLCSYTFFEQCQHRMACAKCDFYIPKSSSRAQLLEAKANLQRMLIAIPLTDDEKAAVDDGQEALDKLLERLADTPAPDGSTPRQLACGSAGPPLLQIFPGPPA